MRWNRVILLSYSSIVILIIVLLFLSVYQAIKSNLKILDWAKSIVEWITMVGIVICILYKIFINFSKIRKDNLQHSEDLIKEIFEKEVKNGSIFYNNDEIFKSYVSWAENSDWFQCAERHLEDKAYERIYQAYIAAKRYAKIVIEQIGEKMQQYQDIVEKKLTEAKIPIPAGENFVDWRIKHYDQKFVKHLIFNDAQYTFEKGRKMNKLEVKPLPSEGLYCLNWVEPFATGDKDSLGYLKQVIEKIESDKEVIEIVLWIDALEIKLRNNIWIERLNQERKEIVRQVRFEKKPLKGECKCCPDNLYF